jgi:hypothetical protein
MATRHLLPLHAAVGAQANAEVARLGTTSASLKLKGIDGGPHKQRSVWFNSTQRAEPYPGWTWHCKLLKGGRLRGCATDAAWLSSARVVRCWVKSRNERNPYGQLPVSGRTAPLGRKAGMTSSPHGSYAWGDTHATMSVATRSDRANGSESLRTDPVQIGGCNSPP